MQEAANKKLIRRFYEEVWGQGNLTVMQEVFDADYVRHDLRPTPSLPGPAGQAKWEIAARKLDQGDSVTALSELKIPLNTCLLRTSPRLEPAGFYFELI